MPKTKINKSAGRIQKRIGLWTSLVAVGAVILLIIACTALWFNRYIFDTDNFTSIATSAVLSDSSRQALATDVSDRILAGKPVLKNFLSDPLTKLTAGLLDTNAAEKVFDRAVSRLHTIATSKQPESIVLDLAGLKSTLGKISDVAGQISDQTPGTLADAVNNLPDQLTLLDASNVPNIYGLGQVMLWLGPLALLGALVLLFLPIYWGRRFRASWSKILAIEGGIVLVGGLFAETIGPLFKPSVLANIKDDNLRVVVENLYNAFLAKFNDQVVWILILGLVLILVALGLWGRPYLKQLQAKRR